MSRFGIFFGIWERSRLFLIWRKGISKKQKEEKNFLLSSQNSVRFRWRGGACARWVLGGGGRHRGWGVMNIQRGLLQIWSCEFFSLPLQQEGESPRPRRDRTRFSPRESESPRGEVQLVHVRDGMLLPRAHASGKSFVLGLHCCF